jgi:hypothetical protein
MKNAIVTFAIGKQYEDMYNSIFHRSVDVYCKKYGIDLVIVKEPFEKFEQKYALCCQKLLICSQEWAKKYDAICWLESDIIISPSARNIFDEVTDDKILFVEHNPYNDSFFGWIWANKTNILDKTYDEFKEHSDEHYKTVGVYSDSDDTSEVQYINEGVTVFQPKYHAEYLESLYRSHDFTVKVNQVGKDNTVNVIGETWWWYKIMIDKKHRFIDYKYDSQWNYYRRLHLEPFDDPKSLIIPIKNYIDNSYFCHIGDRENIDLIHFVDKVYYRHMDITLIVKYKTGDDISWLFSSYIRAKKFKNIYIVSDSDYVKNMIYQTFPRQQNGNYLPNNFYTFVKDVPDNITGRVLECSSDWVKYNEFQYFLELCCDIKNDNNDHINLKILD